MRTIDKPTSLLCALCVIGGALLLIRPIDEKLILSGDVGGYSFRGLDAAEHISKAKSRVYGGLAIFFGVGVGGTALRRERK